MFRRRRSFPLLRRMSYYLSFARVCACGLGWSFFFFGKSELYLIENITTINVHNKKHIEQRPKEFT